MLAKRFTLFILLVVLVMVITNPREKDYLYRIANDYGLVHAGAQLQANDLLEMGEGLSHDYLLFSSYQYSFGNMSVSYFGILNSIYYTGSRSGHRMAKESLALSF